LRQTGFVYHDDFLRHHTGPGHPERPERLRHLIAHLKTTAILSDLAAIPACPAEWSWIEAVHPRSYIEHIRGYRSASRKSACNADLYFLDSDTVVSEHSLEVACLAAGSVAAACDAVMNGEIRNAFCAIRPPGHHAERARAMGFCLFNNVAIARAICRRSTNSSAFASSIGMCTTATARRIFFIAMAAFCTSAFINIRFIREAAKNRKQERGRAKVRR
jgi:acetoin utilization deacetylase AcuC-like enzyme